MVAALKSNGIYESTLIIISAKHGQSPIDSARYLGISNSTGDPITTSPATILDGAGCLPTSESPSNPTGIGPTEDDVSLVWLNSSCTTASAVSMLRSTSPTTNNIAGIGEIFSGPILTTYFNAPGLPPNGDPRTPDIIVTPNIGVTYSGSTKKLAEHGGFSRDDTNVILLVSNPRLPGGDGHHRGADCADRSDDSGRAGPGPLPAPGRATRTHPGTAGCTIQCRRRPLRVYD